MSDEAEQTQSEASETPSSEGSRPSEPDSGEAETAGTDPAEVEQLRQQNQQLQQQNQQITQAVNQYFAQGGGQPAQQNPQPEQSAVDYDELEDEWLTSPGQASRKLSEQIQQNVLGQTQQALQPLLQSQAQTAKSVAQQDPTVADVFERYGHEVEQYVANVAPQHKANPELWKKAAGMVKADHLDEFVQERAQEIAAQAGSQSEAGSSGDRSRSRPSMKEETRSKLESSAYGRKLLGKYGADGLRDHVNRVRSDLGVSSFEEYVDMVAETEAFSDADNPGEIKNRSLGRGGRS